MKNVLIIGAGDLGKEIVWLIEDINKQHPTYLILGFLDDDKSKAGSEFYGYKVLGGTEQLSELSKKMPLSAVVAIQDGNVRKRIVEANSSFDSWENIIHPTACIASSCVIGKGNIVFPQVTISVDTRLGDFGLYYIHASIGNDTYLGNYVSVMQDAIIREHDQINDLCCIDVGTKIPPHTKYGFLKKVVLIGAGGFGRETAIIIEDINRFLQPTYELLGFLDDNESYQSGDLIIGYPWLGTHKWAEENSEDIVYVCTVADVNIRAQIQNELMEKGVVFETIQAPGSYVANTAEIGQGCVIYTGVMVSANVKIGNGVLLNAFTTIGHDVIIDDYTSISPNVGVSGGCKVGTKVNIGGHSYLIPGRLIEEEAVIGAGSIVVTNVKKGKHVFGNPAKKIDF